MGTDELTDEIFEIEDKNGARMGMFLTHGDGSWKKRTLSIDAEFGEIELTKPLATRLVKELIKEFKIILSTRENSWGENYW